MGSCFSTASTPPTSAASGIQGCRCRVFQKQYVGGVMTDVPVPELNERVAAAASEIEAGLATIVRGNGRHDDEAWMRFKHTSVVSTRATLLLENLGDIHPFRDAPMPTFPNVRTLVVRNCNKNFVFYWISKGAFPNASTILTNSSCDGVPMCTFPASVTVVCARGTEGTYLRKGAFICDAPGFLEC